MALPTGGYTFTPQTANLGASPLSALKPLDVGVSVSFTPMPKYEVPSAGSELVSVGMAQGLQGFSEPIISAYKALDDEAKKKEDDALKYLRDINLAKIKAEKTPEELRFEKDYNEARIANLNSLTKERGGDKVPINTRRKGFFKDAITPIGNSDNSDLPKDPTSSVDPNQIFAPMSSVDQELPQSDLSRFNRGGVLADVSFQQPSVTATAPFEPVISQEQIEAVRNPPIAYMQAATGGVAVQPAPMPEKEVRAAIPVTPTSDVRTAAPLYEPNDLIAPYESWEDAEMANEMLAKQLPNYEVKPVKQQVVDGQTYYIVEPPVKKQTQEQIPSNLAVKSAKKQVGDVTYDLIPKGEIKQQVKALKEPLGEIDTMLRTINQIRSIYKGISPGAGGVGALLSYIPGTDAADVEKLTNTLQGNIAFKKLADMKAASPTGGALGAISERELSLLASNLGSIDPKLSFFLFKQNLDEIENIVSRSKQGIEQEIQSVENPQNFQSIQSKENIVEIKSQEEWKKLKSGQKYIFNGVTGSKK
jgi:hypothetical protein